MNARQRFLETVRRGRPDRIPYYDWEVREDVLEQWYEQGMPRGMTAKEYFAFDRWEVLGHHEDVPLVLDPLPRFEGELKGGADFERLKRCYDPTTPGRYPDDWPAHVTRWREREHVLGIVVWEGFLESLAVGDWRSLTNLLYHFHDAPDLVEDAAAHLTDFAIATIERALDEVEFDFAMLYEPCASNHAPVFSPQHLRRFMLANYRRLTSFLRAKGIDLVIVWTQGAVGPMIPVWVEGGINGLWVCSAAAGGVDYAELRRRYGPDLVLLGGIDARALYEDRAAIDRAMAHVPALLAQGAYIPMADERVRCGVLFANYRYYREQIRKLAEQMWRTKP